MPEQRSALKRVLIHARDLIADAAKGWSDHGAPQIAAALSYYALLSLAPLLMVVVAVAGRVVTARAATEQLLAAAEHLAGEIGTAIIEELISSAAAPAQGTFFSVIALFIALFGAARVFGQLRIAFDRIWDIPPERHEATTPLDAIRSALRSLAAHNLRAFAMVLIVGVLLLASLLFNALVAAVSSGRLPFDLPLPAPRTLDVLLSFALLYALFAAIYRVLPRAHIGRKDVAVGAAMTSALFTLGRFLVGLYLAHSSVGSAFGAAGTLVVFLVWLNYNSQIILFGAELTRAWTYRFGTRSEDARAAADRAAVSPPEPNALLRSDSEC